MKGAYRDLMTVDDFFQALFQDRELFREHGNDRHGGKIDGYQTAGCYHSAADGYGDAGSLEPKKTVRLTTTSGDGEKRGGGKASGRRCKPG